MNFVDSLSLFHVDAKEIPCLTEKGAPSEKTEGAPGVLYMDTDTGVLYKCRAADPVNGVFAWEEAVRQDSSQNVKLPTNEDGTPNYGTVGYYAVSDGVGGIKWVETTPDTGGGNSGDTTTHGIVWDLVNVTSSSSVVSVSDGAALVATLTPANGYILGDVTVTMNGEALTGVWDADTATVTILSVTGDVVISCAGVYQTEQSEVLSITWGSNIALTTFDVTETVNYASAGFSELRANKIRFQWNPEESNGFQIAIAQFDAEGKPHKLSKVSAYSATPITDGANINVWVDPGECAYTAIGGGDITVELPTTGSVGVILRRSSATGTENNSDFGTWLGNGGLTITAIYSGVVTAEDTMTVDEDYAMDYGVATTALVTDGATSTKTGIDSAYAAVLEQAKNAWMLEANGDINKIPLIIHTDQHGSMNGNNKTFPFLAEIVNWYDVSKVVNLGDTMSFWTDSDPNRPWTSCDGLDKYLEEMADVPYSKRIEIYGNHDTWNTSYETAENQAYLHKYFRNIYARRADNYGNFVVKDDNYNVKYVVVSGFAYDSTLGGYTHYVVHPDAIRWVISELAKADGYDVIILSHVPLGGDTTTVYNPIDGTTEDKVVGGISYKKLTELWSGRKSKTSGTVTDEYGTVYEFDFTGCDGELLCGLHGHIHEDGYYYIDELLDAYFDGHLNDKATHFVLVDRANRQLNVWKTDSTPQVQNYQIPFDKPETTE